MLGMEMGMEDGMEDGVGSIDLFRHGGAVIVVQVWRDIWDKEKGGKIIGVLVVMHMAQSIGMRERFEVSSILATEKEYLM